MAAVATRDPDRRARAEAENPGVRVVDDLDALLQVPDLDMVVLTTPTGLHHAHALQVIAAGLPLVVEKPLGVDLAQVREVVEAAHAARVPLSVYLQRRFDPSHRIARDLVASGKLGEVWRFEFRWERWEPTPPDRWRENTVAAHGGGKLLDLGPHMVDLAFQLFGPVEAVYAQVEARRQVGDDESHLTLHHISGQTSQLDICTLVAAPGPRMRLIGSAGTWVFDDSHAGDSDQPTYPDLADAPGCCGWLYGGATRQPVPGVEQDWSAFYRQFFTALRAADPTPHLPVSPADVVHIAEVLDAAFASAEGRRVVRLGG